jgi:uncharacterized membrane protein YidH (DUF202 family)
MDSRNGALLLIAIGVAIVVIGALAWLGWLSWFGRLPGDIRIANGNTRVYIPITTMIIVSVVLSLVSYVARRFL